jgi:hypothetical protein
MIKQLATVAATLALLVNPAGATPERRVVNPGEVMVLVPGLEELGYSRISTVEHCSEIVGARDWADLMTDSEFEGMEACLVEHT